MGFFKKKKTNYGKIVAITLAVVAGVSAIAFVVYKLIKKYTEDLVYDCDDLLDECEECDVCIDEAEEEEACEAGACEAGACEAEACECTCDAE